LGEGFGPWQDKNFPDQFWGVKQLQHEAKCIPPICLDDILMHGENFTVLLSSTALVLFQESSLLRENLIQAIMAVARATHSHSIVLIHGTAAWSELLNQQLQNYSQQHTDSLCLAGVYALYSRSTKDLIGAISSTKLMVTDDIINTLKPGTMVVLLLEELEEIRAFLEVCQYINGLVFLSVPHSWSINAYAGNQTQHV